MIIVLLFYCLFFVKNLHSLIFSDYFFGVIKNVSIFAP